MDRHGIQTTKIQTRLELPDVVVNPDVYKGAFTKTKVFMRWGYPKPKGGNPLKPRQGIPPNPEKRPSFLSGLMTKHPRHCSRAVGAEPCRTRARKLGARGTPLQEPNTQHAEPHSTTRERHGTDSLPPCFSHEPRPCGSASQNVAGATRRVTRESNALHVSRSLLERQRASRGVIIGIVVPRPRRDVSRASESVQRGNI